MDWLYCDFHIHTTWSDGALSISEIVELFGSTGFDVIAITDHVLDSGSLQDGRSHSTVPEDQFSQYLQELWSAARHAWERWNMLVIPGVELTNNTSKYHILALDVKEYINPDLGVEEIIEAIRFQGGVSVACHPYIRNHSGEAPSEYLWTHHERLASLFDAWEVANRDDLFNVVGLKKFNYIANSDFHEEKHLRSWKTLLRCRANIEAVKQAIRSNEAVSLFLYRGGPLKALQSPEGR
ncbi:phosphotransferase [Chlorobium phaeovibrioides]|uniref:Phosphotransferase n=1 Tax=Chlorobium phaeovibrioides TaxID=1094 RepID=A0A3S0L300_CHLPH|nr:PHP domain-containing protein [Chlorobium phaeovibrioides]KAA6232696.1 phosphotransferase [Chlorobium phaeovibrioides]RTY39863.1 phosphotransferase [Chlorobium phaeovibrioides]